MEAMETAVLGEALQQAIGERKVKHLVFCTHDLEPEFFEEEILQTFLGNDLQHNRRTRQLQLDYEIRQRDVKIDVYYEGRALAAHEGTARLGWNRIRMSGKRGGVFHPKLVLALCHDADGAESLVVCTGSANLTRGGWWTNVECVDVVRLEDGERHGYLGGLVETVKQLHRAHSQTTQAATAAVRAFLTRPKPFLQRTDRGVLRPMMLPPHKEFGAGLQEALAGLVDGTHLEIIAPFHDPQPSAEGSALAGLLEWFAPSSTTVLLPMRDGATTLSRETYDDLTELADVAWGELPPRYVRTSAGVDAVDRGLHAKVYRFWRGGSDPVEVIVVGSHNLTSAAHRGDTNAEVSVVHQVVPPRGRPLLDRLTTAPDSFDALDPEGDAAEPSAALPMTVCFDWAASEATAATVRWDKGGLPPHGVELLRAGRTVCRISIEQSQTIITLPEAAASALRAELLSSCVLTAHTDDGAEAPLLVVELNHPYKPDLLSGAELTTAEILALWSLSELRDRLSLVGRARAGTAADEVDLDSTPDASPPVSMFDQFAGVFHAFSELRRRVAASVEAGELDRAGAAVYGSTFDSPRSVLELAFAGTDPVLAYVIHRCAQLLDEHVAQQFAAVVERFPEPRTRLQSQLAKSDALREQMVAAVPMGEQAALREFIAWFDSEFAAEDPA